MYNNIILLRWAGERKKNVLRAPVCSHELNRETTKSVYNTFKPKGARAEDRLFGDISISPRSAAHKQTGLLSPYFSQEREKRACVRSICVWSGLHLCSPSKNTYKNIVRKPTSCWAECKPLWFLHFWKFTVSQNEKKRKKKKKDSYCGRVNLLLYY